MKQANHEWSQNRPHHAMCLILACLLANAFAQGAQPAGPGKKATAVRLHGTLSLDGRLEDAAWSAAPAQTGFEQTLGKGGRRRPLPKNAPRTAFRVLYDDNTLYFGVRCDEPKMDELVAKAGHTWDAAMWSDDDVEIFLDPVGNRQEFYQFAINTDGVQTDLYAIEGGHTQKDPWSSEWKAVVFKGRDFWSLEVAIPFAALYNRSSKMWKENWVFSISRTRMPAPRCFSQYSPGNGYHDIANFGTLGPIRIDRSRFNLYADAPRFRLEPEVKGFRVTGDILLEDRGDKPVQGALVMDILGPKSRNARHKLSMNPRESRRVTISGAYVRTAGKYGIIFRVLDKTGVPRLLARFDERLDYRPVAIKLTQPNYSNNIYATQRIDTVTGVISLNLSPKKMEGCVLKIGMYSTQVPPRETTLPVAKTVSFSLDAKNLPEGRYMLRAALLRQRGKDPKVFPVVTEAATTLRKLPPAAEVEVRISPSGNLLIDGNPVFIRGWYGSMYYVGSAAALPQAQLPQSTNFIMGADTFEQTDLGLYTLAGVSRLVDEKKAKLDQPIDDALSMRLLAAIARTQAKRRVIGYYISDEPECRGLSPYFLKSLYEFMKEHDPYRMVMIVSRAPARYIQACDVICPHPYLGPQTFEDGARRFNTPPTFIGSVIREAVRANDGSRAVWVMPQTFSYGGLRGRNPDFLESRFFTFAGIAAGARGVVPFIFNGFWNHWENRVSMNHIFETLTLLAPIWTAEDSAAEAAGDNGAIAVLAKDYRPPKTSRHFVFLVAVNQTYDRQTAVIRCPALAEHKVRRLVVLRENRTIDVAPDGHFRDTFGRLGVHIYTSLDVLPSLASLQAIRREIAVPRERAATEGNLLAQGRVKWRVSDSKGNFSDHDDLADGVTDAGGWIPWYGDRTQMILELDRAVTVRRVVVHTPSLRAVTMEAWLDGAWKKTHRWEDQALERLIWTGAPITTNKFRFTEFVSRPGPRGNALPEITELGLYEK